MHGRDEKTTSDLLYAEQEGKGGVWSRPILGTDAIWKINFEKNWGNPRKWPDHASGSARIRVGGKGGESEPEEGLT